VPLPKQTRNPIRGYPCDPWQKLLLFAFNVKLETFLLPPTISITLQRIGLHISKRDRNGLAAPLETFFGNVEM
jgi:hypothetical protein